jgi:hypothetical protein
VREALEICRTARTILGANGISYAYPVMRHAGSDPGRLTRRGALPGKFQRVAVNRHPIRPPSHPDGH